MQSAGAKRDAADDLLEVERAEETALRPGNENVHILVEAERIAADRKEDGSPEAQDEKVAAALEAPQLSEQAARAPGPPPPPLAGRLRLLPGRPLPPARQRTAPAGLLQHGHQRPHRLLHVRNVPGLRSELLRPDAELRSRVNPSASAADARAPLHPSHHQGTARAAPAPTRPAARLRHRPGRAGALGGDSDTKQGFPYPFCDACPAGYGALLAAGGVMDGSMVDRT